MGDPITMAVVGASAGALMNKKDPLKGALLGAAGGFGGATLMAGGAAAAGTAGTAAGTGSALTGAGASTAANTAFMNAAGVNAGANAAMGAGQAAGYTSAAVPSTIFSTVPSTQTASLQAAQPLSSTAGQTAALERPLSLTSPGVEPGQGYEYTMGDRLAQVGQFAQQNPALVAMAAQTGQGLLQRPNEPQVQSAGLLRGNPSQLQAPQYQVGIPQVTLI